MPSAQELLSPDYLGEKRITLALHVDAPIASEGAPVVVTVDYSAASPEGIVLPVVLTVTNPSGVPVLRRLFQHVLPVEVEWTPESGGPHLVRIAEVFHNLWFGTLTIDVVGDEQGVD